jgi:ligand-binding sensor domain-containing protein
LYEDGLNRYDGYSFKIYRSAVNDSNTTQFFQFYDIVEDKYGRLWVGTSSGLFYLDTQTDRLVSLMKQINEGLINSPLDSRINSVYIDSRGTLWVSSYNGIAKINITRPMFQICQLMTSNCFCQSRKFKFNLNNSVYTIVEDEKGKF